MNERQEINRRALDAINIVLEGGLTRTQIAEGAGIRPQTLSEMTRGKMNVSTEFMKYLCENHEISADWIITGRGSARCVENPEVRVENISSDIVALQAENRILREQLEWMKELIKNNYGTNTSR